ncbi:MAG: DUF5060 domain-containing protein [Planctomycetales bacterium]|nr:DUF5060 domain-containing protein [Planctomycetales bacterium]
MYRVITQLSQLCIALLAMAWMLMSVNVGVAQNAQASVEQWGMYELTLAGPADGNPFVDVTLTARFVQGDRTITVPGFYDGDGAYRIRFMPPTQGAWQYSTAANRDALNGKSGELTVGPPTAGNHGPVQVVNTYHFAYADGTPYKQLGTTCYVWNHQDEALQRRTLETLAKAPFNKIRFCVFPKRYDWNRNEPIFYPYEGTPPNLWKKDRFNPRFFQHLERCITELQQLGIEADIILLHPYDGNHWGFDRMTAEEDDRYLRYVVSRLAAYRNVWWSLANEYDFMKEKQESDWVRFGEIVHHQDPFHHLLSIHNGTRIFNHTLPWITHASIQNGSAVEDAARAVLYRDVYRKPVVFDEVKYEGDIPRRWGNLSAEELVHRFWEGTIAGTYVGHGETYLSDDDILWWSKGGVLKGQSPARLAFLRDVLEQSPAAGIEPIDKWQNPEFAGQSSEYYLIYFGTAAPKTWEFKLPSKATPNGEMPTDGMKFTAEILDTWQMTTTPVADSFTLAKRDDYFFGDKDGRTLELPGKPYVAIRLKRSE